MMAFLLVAPLQTSLSRILFGLVICHTTFQKKLIWQNEDYLPANDLSASLMIPLDPNSRNKVPGFMHQTTSSSTSVLRAGWDWLIVIRVQSKGSSRHAVSHLVTVWGGEWQVSLTEVPTQGTARKTNWKCVNAGNVSKSQGWIPHMQQNFRIWAVRKRGREEGVTRCRGKCPFFAPRHEQLHNNA